MPKPTSKQKAAFKRYQRLVKMTGFGLTSSKQLQERVNEPFFRDSLMLFGLKKLNKTYGQVTSSGT